MDGTGEGQEKVKIWLKVKTMQDFHGYMSNITTWLLTRCFPGSLETFHTCGNTEVGGIAMNGIYPTTEVTLSVKDLSMIDWGLAKLAAFAAKEVVENRNDRDGWNHDFYEDLLRRIDDLQSRLNASMPDLR